MVNNIKFDLNKISQIQDFFNLKEINVIFIDYLKTMLEDTFLENANIILKDDTEETKGLLNNNSLDNKNVMKSVSQSAREKFNSYKYMFSRCNIENMIKN